MVARLFRLRVALAGGAFRGGGLRGVRFAAIVVLACAAAIFAAVLPTLMFEPGAIRNAVDVTVGGFVVFLACAIPLFDSRRYLVPRQFAQFPAGTGRLGSALLITSVATWPGLVCASWFVTLIATRPGWRENGSVTAIALILIVMLLVIGVRLFSAISQLWFGERYAGGLRLTGWIFAIALLPLLVFAVTETVRSDDNVLLMEAERAAGWTPFGAGFAAIVAAEQGEFSQAAAHLAVLGVTVLVFGALWFVVVELSLHSIERPLDASSARHGLGWFERFPARPSQVIAARQLTYWARDPRYRVALFALPVAPIAILVAFLVAGADPKVAALLPLPVLLLLLGWSQHNDIAMDSTAIWEHVASGLRGWADRAGRLAPVLLLGVPLAIIGSSVTVTFTGDWRMLPAVIGMNIGILFVATGVASTFSALIPYPATRPGDSPFVQPQWSGSGSGTSQTLSMLVALVFSIPPVWASLGAIADMTFVSNVWALAFGVSFGLAVLFGGVWIGGRIFDKKGPEILAVTQIFD